MQKSLAVSARVTPLEASMTHALDWSLVIERLMLTQTVNIPQKSHQEAPVSWRLPATNVRVRQVKSVRALPNHI